ncbi:unnamed protein product [Durusdinium trenchii]|uniref:Secreted protein n=1 Tax=Durusdinium trenchii TaxID=1381693 RepID=A0ABP0RKU4_9DINO
MSRLVPLCVEWRSQTCFLMVTLGLKRHGLGCMPKCSLHPSPRTWKRSVQLKAAAGFVKTGWSKRCATSQVGRVQLQQKKW